MKKEFEKFLIWYIPLSIFSGMTTAIWLPKLTDMYVQGGNDAKVAMWFSFLAMFFGMFHKIVAAIWLWIQIKKENGRFILWALFGFYSGMWAVAFHVALALFDEMKVKPKVKSTPLEQSGANNKG